jgi:mono/diheme cytochrome c family protein
VGGRIDREGVLIDAGLCRLVEETYRARRGDMYTVIKKGIPPTMMAAWDGRIPDDDIWSIIHYIRALAPKK